MIVMVLQICLSVDELLLLATYYQEIHAELRTESIHSLIIFKSNEVLVLA